VELQPNRGAFVALIDAPRVREVFLVLGALEALAGELVCTQATDAQVAEIRALHYQMVLHQVRGDLAAYFRCNQDIHARLVEFTGNATLVQSWRALNAKVQRVRYMANLSGERWQQAVREHETMLEALGARDGARLGSILRDILPRVPAEMVPEPHAFDDATWLSNRLSELMPVPALAKQKLMELEDADMRLEIIYRFLGQQGLK
jgi:DNA-binding GntR family transcriptional regulator